MTDEYKHLYEAQVAIANDLRQEVERLRGENWPNLRKEVERLKGELERKAIARRAESDERLITSLRRTEESLNIKLVGVKALLNRCVNSVGNTELVNDIAAWLEANNG